MDVLIVICEWTERNGEGEGCICVCGVKRRESVLA